MFAPAQVECFRPGLSDPMASADDMPKDWQKSLEVNLDSIGTTIVDPNQIRSYVRQAAERGIPAIAFNVADAQDPDPSLPPLLYSGSDEFLIGISNARRVFAQAQADGSITDVAIGQLADYFKAHPETRAVFIFAPSPAAALHQYMLQAGVKPHQLYATTHDTTPEVTEMIRDSYLLQTIDQEPYMQGFQAIVSLYLYHQYGVRPSGFINTSSVVDANNVDFVSRLMAAGYR